MNRIRQSNVRDRYSCRGVDATATDRPHIQQQETRDWQFGAEEPLEIRALRGRGQAGGRGVPAQSLQLQVYPAQTADDAMVEARRSLAIGTIEHTRDQSALEDRIAGHERWSRLRPLAAPEAARYARFDSKDRLRGVEHAQHTGGRRRDMTSGLERRQDSPAWPELRVLCEKPEAGYVSASAHGSRASSTHGVESPTRCHLHRHPID